MIIPKSIRGEMSYLGQNKIMSHPERVAEWYSTGTTRPVTVELDPSDVCNHRCPQCAGGRKSKNIMTFDLMKRVIKELDGCKGIIFTGGGEPLCNKNSPAAVAYARRRGKDVGFITNGGLLNEEISRTLVLNCTWIRVSIDAASPGRFAKTHGMGKEEFSKVWKNLEALCRIRDQEGSSCTVGAAYLTDADAIDGMYEFARMAREAGVEYCQYRPFHFNKDSILPYLDECKKLETPSFKVIDSRHKYELMQGDSWLRRYEVCHGHHFATVISAEAKVYLCCHMRGKDKYCLGDLNEESFLEIWHSSRREQVYRSIDFKDCPPMCRCDTFNEVLWQIKKTGEGKHLNFL